MITATAAIGVILAICGNVLISASLNLQKYIHNKIAASGETKTPTGRPKYLVNKIWWYVALFYMHTYE